MRPSARRHVGTSVQRRRTPLCWRLALRHHRPELATKRSPHLPVRLGSKAVREMLVTWPLDIPPSWSALPPLLQSKA